MSRFDIWPRLPSQFVETSPVFERGAKADRALLCGDLESKFEVMFGNPAIITSSGRSAISLALNCLNIGRKHTVYSSKFSSHCVWSTLTRYSNPSYFLSGEIDALLAIHQYGYAHALPNTDFDFSIIEDSCDSIIVDIGSMFPNQGKVEIFSLPKVMGSYGGGVMVFGCEKLYAECKERIEQAQIPELTDPQDEKRLDIALNRADPFDASLWDALEWQNYCPSYNLLKHLDANFEALNRNRDLILERVAYLAGAFGDIIEHVPDTAHRVPPLLRLRKGHSDPETPTRYVSPSRVVGSLDYEERDLVPIHFGVSSSEFEALLESLDRMQRDFQNAPEMAHVSPPPREAQ